MPRPPCAAPGCKRRGIHRHHLVYRQHCLRAGASLADSRNLVWLCLECHLGHHNRAPTLPASVFSEEAWAFAREALGESAELYVARYYPRREPPESYTT